MKRFAAFLAIALALAMGSPARAFVSTENTDAYVVSSCGAQAFPLGVWATITQDTTGKLCDTGASGGGGGPATLAPGSVSVGAYLDGAIITLGTEADAAWTTGSGTLIAMSKAIAGDLGAPGATACATDTGSCSVNQLLQRIAQRLTTAIGGTAISGPLGASVSAPTTPVSVVEPDDFNVCTGSNTCTASGATTLLTQDMLGYESITVEVIANASANIITFETSDDNTNWIASTGVVTSSAGNSAGAGSYSATANTMLHFAKHGEFFRARVSTFVGGTTTVVSRLHKNPAQNVNSNLNLQTATVAIGKVGPGYTSGQTPLTATATGTTAATVATFPAVSSKTNYLCGFSVTADATTALAGTTTIAGTISGSMNFIQNVGAATAAGELQKTFAPCIPASATNTAITVTSAAAGVAGNTDVNMWGYVE